MKAKVGGMLLGAMIAIYAAVIVPRVVERASQAAPTAPDGVLEASRKPGERHLRPEDPLPDAPAADPKDIATVRGSLRTLSKADELRRGGCGNIYIGGGRFLFERDFHYREFRLLAEAYPEAAERVAQELLAKPMESATYNAGVWILSYLGRQGRRRAELLLLRESVSTSLDTNTRREALYALSDLDRVRAYQDLYRKEWSSGGIWACHFIDLTIDRVSEDFLEKAEGSHYLRQDAERALARLRLLRARDSLSRLVETLQKPPHPRVLSSIEDTEVDERRWALQVARSQGLDLRGVLRCCLDRNLADA